MPIAVLLLLARLVLAPVNDAVAQVQLDRDAYVRAEEMLPWNRDRVLFNADVDAYWIDGSEALWGTSAGRRLGGTATHHGRGDAPSLQCHAASDYFVANMLGATPPAGYTIAGPGQVR